VALSENLDAFLADFGVTVTDGTTTTTGVLDMPSEVIAGMVITTDYALTIKSSVYPNLKYADSLTVDGAAFTVREVRAQDDGKFSIVYLSKV
jgi:riboflavin synthase alpha subunit